MTYKDMYNNYNLKSDKETFKDKNYDEIYEAHLRKLENLYGKDYINNYKRNVQELISFYYKFKKKPKKNLKINNTTINQFFSINGNINYNYIDFLNKIKYNLGYSKKLILKSTQTNIFIIQDEDDFL